MSKTARPLARLSLKDFCPLVVFIVLILLPAGFSACRRPSSEKTYLFLGHPYEWVASGDRVDPRVCRLPLRDYDQIWLGGDVCAKTTVRPEVLRYLDSLFHFEKGNVHWAFGNHDVEQGHEEWLVQATGRPEYYTEWVDGIVVAVLNTNLFQWPNARPPDDFCRRMEGQYAMIRTLADTVKAASQVVFLHHYNLLTDELSENRFAMDTVANYYKPFFKVVCSPDDATFERSVYPLLVAIRKKGIGVILAGGDFGQRAKAFSYQTRDGIWFLGSGINNSADPAYAPAYVTNFQPDKVLLFRHDTARRALEWSFCDLDSLTR